MKQKTGVFAVLTAALFLGGMTGVGCGGDDTTTGGAGAGGTGGSAGTTGGTAGKGGTGGATGGTGGTGGSAGAGTDAGGKAGTAGTDAGGDGPASIRCGTSTCGPIAAGMFGTLDPCCPMGESPNACGGSAAALGGVCLTTSPGTADPSCPMVTLGGFPLPGCCRPNNTCGANLSAIMLGCNDPTLLGGPAGGACGGGGDGGPPPVDSGRGDTGPGTDTGPGDTGPGTDTGPGDTGPGTDTGPGDTGPGTDTGPGGDTGPADSPSSDAPAG